MFSAAMPPPAAATALACLRIVQEEPEHLRRLRRNTEKMRASLESLGFDCLGSRTPIIPLLIGDELTALAFARDLYERGVFATPVLNPAVPPGGALIRTSYMASHSDADLDYALDVLAEVGRAHGVLNGSSAGSGAAAQRFEEPRAHAARELGQP